MPVLTRSRDERGFTMVTVITSMMAVLMLAIAALSAAQGDLPSGKHDTDRKIAYAAAEAGVENFLFHLVEDPNYWAKCTTVSAPVNNPWEGGSATRRWASLPGSRARYTIELLPANGRAACQTDEPDATMIDADSGTFRIRVTGQALALDGVTGVRRTIVVNFKRQSLLDYIYLTDKEGLDPSLRPIAAGGYVTDRLPGAGVQDVTQWGITACNRYWGDDAARGNRAGQQFSGTKATQTGLKINSTWYDFSWPCQEIGFATADVVRGPLHTNDEIACASGSPAVTLGRTPTDAIEVASTGQSGAAPVGYRGCSPNVNFGTSTANPYAGTWRGKADGIGWVGLPPSNASLKRDTAAAYRFVGETSVEMSSASMKVTGTREDGSTLNSTIVPLPADGVLYVANATCTPYDPIHTDAAPAGCGNLEISGTYSADVTFTAENDIVIMNDIKRATGTQALLGLISNNFIRVSHPVANQQFTPRGSGNTVTQVTSECTNNGSLRSLQIDAAIVSLAHSFIVDNYYCGEGLGTLTVNGSIAQYYRGPIATGGGATGYIKNYTYDDRLKYRSPPKFLDPVQAGWVVQTYNEEIPAS